MSEIIVFGFGSLMKIKSLRATVPDAHTIRPAYIKGFRRDFSVWDSVGYTKTEISVGLAGQPYCAVDVRVAASLAMRVNGVVFSIGANSLPSLMEREQNYKLIKTTAYDFESEDKIGECLVFSANKDNGQYAFNSAIQTYYLNECLEGAKKLGERFYQEFLNSTFISDKPLDAIPGLLDI
ncbi:MAG TPA: gamma-glutamylcyclotransferase family protein [Verrucomicrobiae bacterium]|jgi:cation transport regulator ChaC|nr:gamma-glutamylcyclotransferase family protein [Verrucomicrobiae bacterium]